MNILTDAHFATLHNLKPGDTRSWSRFLQVLIECSRREPLTNRQFEVSGVVTGWSLSLRPGQRLALTPRLDAFDDHFVHGTEAAILEFLLHEPFGSQV